MFIGGSAATLGATGSGFGIAAALGVLSASPVGWALAGAGAAIGLGLGTWKLFKWARKKYKTAKELREAKGDRQDGALARLSGFGSDIKSIFWRGKSKIGNELLAEQLKYQGEYTMMEILKKNPLMKRKLMATLLLKNMHSSDENVKAEATGLFKALRLPKGASKMILEDPNAANNEDFVKHVMQKMRGA